MVNIEKQFNYEEELRKIYEIIERLHAEPNAYELDELIQDLNVVHKDFLVVIRNDEE